LLISFFWMLPMAGAAVGSGCGKSGFASPGPWRGTLGAERHRPAGGACASRPGQTELHRQLGLHSQCRRDSLRSPRLRIQPGVDTLGEGPMTAPKAGVFFPHLNERAGSMSNGRATPSKDKILSSTPVAVPPAKQNKTVL
jgi:hypothetical protein